MFSRILTRMKAKVMTSPYVMTHHAVKETNEDDLTVYDVESCILTGKTTERRRDRDTKESKYRVRGKTIDGADIELIGKISSTDNLLIITVYSL
jgi:hypothetical protein